MNFDWEKFQTAFQQANDKTKKIISSNVVVRCVTKISEQYNIPPEMKRGLVINYTNVILNLMTEQEYLNFINIKIKPEVGADKIFSSLLICITEETKNIDTSPDTASVAPPAWESTNSDTEEDDELPAMRTMKHDESRWES